MAGIDRNNLENVSHILFTGSALRFCKSFVVVVCLFVFVCCVCICCFAYVCVCARARARVLTLVCLSVLFVCFVFLFFVWFFFGGEGGGMEGGGGIFFYIKIGEHGEQPNSYSYSSVCLSGYLPVSLSVQGECPALNYFTIVCDDLGRVKHVKFGLDRTKHMIMKSKYVGL